MKKRIFRPVSGVFLLNKASGISSNKALQNARFLFQAKKAGHTGTLDPFATGLLPVCFGEANKFSRWMLGAEKTYEFTITLGEKMDTGDIEGNIIQTSNIPNLNNKDLNLIIPKFLGEITQTPPKFSALRVAGKRAYELARAGHDFEIPSRQVHIHELQLQLISKNQIQGIAKVSKGTYIRVLVEDIAESLGSVGFCSKLHRVQIKHLINEVDTEQNSKLTSYDEIKHLDDQLNELDKYLLPIDVLCLQFPSFDITQEQWKTLVYGQLVDIEPNSIETESIHRLYLDDVFVGLGEIDIRMNYLKAFRLINTMD